jgi:UDP-N-acetylmuramate dehydrogenase
VQRYSNASLAQRTTLRVGGPARELVVAESEDELVDAVRQYAAEGPVLVMGSGSNLLIGDDGFDGVVVTVATRGIREDSMSACGGAMIGVAAGEPWDELVQYAISRRWTGVEALSGIPGLVGATPIQNVGAYGAEVSDTVARVRVYDRQDDRVRTLFPFDCQFGYRTSRFKQNPGRFVVLEVYYQLEWGDLSGPIRYGQLADRLGVEVGDSRVPVQEVRDAVLDLRRAKGMVLEDADHDTWSAGSFFTNPVVAREQVPAGAPQWPLDGDHVKTSAAWLIEQAGYERGHAGPAGRAAVSNKHTLALTNRGGATAEELLELARDIRATVRQRFEIELQPEPVLVGCAL